MAAGRTRNAESIETTLLYHINFGMNSCFCFQELKYAKLGVQIDVILNGSTGIDNLLAFPD